MEIDHLSHSAVNMALRCPRQYFYRYVMGLKIPGSAALLLGKSFAKTMERNFAQKVGTRIDLPIDEVLNFYGETFDYGQAYDDIEWKKDDPGKVKDDGYLMVGGYMGLVAPEIQPVGVEERAQRHVVAEDLPPFYVILDLIEEREFGIDHKTAGRAWPKRDEFNQIQHYPYMSYLGEKFGCKPWETEFEYHVAARSRARKRAKQLKAFLKAKPSLDGAAIQQKRKELAEIVDIRPVRITQEGFDWYVENVRNVVREIRSEIWTCRPGGWWCSEGWCGYWNRCRGRTMPKSFTVDEAIELVAFGEL